MLDRDLPLKKEISINIKRLMKENNWTQVKLSKESGISKSTLSDYINCKTLISTGNVEKLSQTFSVKKSEIDPSFKSAPHSDENSESKLPNLSLKDERDIQKNLQKMIDELSQDGYAAFDGQGIDDMEEEDRELLIASLENSLRLAKRIAKQKFTPKKYRK